MRRALALGVLYACAPAATTAGPKATEPVALATPPPLAVGDKAPPLRVQNATRAGGPAITLADGKANLVWFFATWSAPDKYAMPKIEELRRRFGGLGLSIVAVSVDDEEQNVALFAQESGASFDVGWDEGHRVAAAWRPSHEPTFFLVDGSGVVRRVYAGYHDGDAEQMAVDIQRMLPHQR